MMTQQYKKLAMLQRQDRYKQSFMFSTRTARQIEAVRRAKARYLKRGGKVWIRVFPDKLVTVRGFRGSRKSTPFAAQIAMDKKRPFRRLWIARIGAVAILRAQIEKVAFDRSGFRYLGRVKALADAAREGGLQF